MADALTRGLKDERKLTSAGVLAGLVLLCLSVGLVGSLFTTPKLDSWYRTLEKPGFNPPDGVFGPVWTTLYLLMAVSAWLVWKAKGTSRVASAATLFGVCSCC